MFNERLSLERRDLLKLAGAAGVAGFGGASMAEAAQAAPDITAGNPEAAIVDFAVRCSNGSFSADGKGSVTVSVTNVGALDASGDVSVILISPFWANFDPALPPAGFSSYIVKNASPFVPEMIECLIPKASLPKDGPPVDLTVSLVLVSGGPVQAGKVKAIVRSLGDTEASLLNNTSTAAISKPVTPLPTPPAGANIVNLLYTFTKPLLATGGTTNLNFLLGNKGPNALSSDAVFVFVTPYMVKINRNDLIFKGRNPHYFHNHTNPRIPDIVSITIPKLLLLPALYPLALHSLSIPLIASAGANPQRHGKAMLAAKGNDVDSNISIAMGVVGVLQP